MRSFLMMPVCLLFFSLPAVGNAASFSDVTAKTEYRTAIEYLADQGIINGYGDGRFGPEDTLTRAELLKILLEAKDDFVKPATPTEKCFPDVETFAWYAPYVCYAKEAGMVQGFPDGMFRPSNEVSFVEAAKLTVKIVKNTSKDGTGYSNWYEGYVRELFNYNAVPESVTFFEQRLNRGELTHIVSGLLQNIRSSFAYEKYKKLEDNSAQITGGKSVYGLWVFNNKRPLSISWLDKPTIHESTELPFSLFKPENESYAEFTGCKKTGKVSKADAKYAEWDMVLCTKDHGFYGSVSRAYPFRILTNGTKHHIVYENSQQYLFDVDEHNDDYMNLFSKAEISQLMPFFITDVVIQGIDYPFKMEIPTPHGDIRLSYFDLSFPTDGVNSEFEPKKVIYTHPVWGNLYRGSGKRPPDGFFFITPDGVPRLYQVDYSSILPLPFYDTTLLKDKPTFNSTDINPSDYHYNYSYHCEAGEDYVYLPDEVVDLTYLNQVGATHSGSPVYALKNFENPIFEFILQNYDSGLYSIMNPEPFYESPEDWTKIPPLLLWQDPLGNWLRLYHSRFGRC